MSKNYSGYAKDVMSGDFMQSSNMLQGVKSNLSFRLSSAREMVMGLTDSSAMSPVQRRMEIRNRRLELLGIKEDSDTSARRRSQESNNSSIGGPTKTSRPSSPSSESGNPLMSEVNRGTKARAEERGFGA